MKIIKITPSRRTLKKAKHAEQKKQNNKNFLQYLIFEEGVSE